MSTAEALALRKQTNWLDIARPLYYNKMYVQTYKKRCYTISHSLSYNCVTNKLNISQQMTLRRSNDAARATLGGAMRGICPSVGVSNGSSRQSHQITKCPEVPLLTPITICCTVPSTRVIRRLRYWFGRRGERWAGEVFIGGRPGRSGSGGCWSPRRALGRRGSRTD